MGGMKGNSRDSSRIEETRRRRVGKYSPTGSRDIFQRQLVVAVQRREEIKLVTVATVTREMKKATQRSDPRYSFQR